MHHAKQLSLGFTLHFVFYQSKATDPIRLYKKMFAKTPHYLSAEMPSTLLLKQNCKQGRRLLLFLLKARQRPFTHKMINEKATQTHQKKGIFWRKK